MKASQFLLLIQCHGVKILQVSVSALVQSNLDNVSLPVDEVLVKSDSLHITRVIQKFLRPLVVESERELKVCITDSYLVCTPVVNWRNCLYDHGALLVK